MATPFGALLKKGATLSRPQHASRFREVALRGRVKSDSRGHSKRYRTNTPARATTEKMDRELSLTFQEKPEHQLKKAPVTCRAL